MVYGCPDANPDYHQPIMKCRLLNRTDISIYKTK